MAGKRLSVSLTLNDKQFQSGLRKATRSMAKFGKSMQRTGQSLSRNLTLPLVAFGAASVAAFDKQAKAQAKLQTALGDDAKAYQRLTQLARELQTTTLFGDEATIEAASFLAQLGLNEEAITRLLPLIQDFATAQNMQLGDAAKLVAKSVGSSTNALSRYGIAIEGSVGETERLDSAVNALSNAFGGNAEAAAKVGAGALIQLKNQFGDLMEDIGAMLIPILIDLGQEFKKLLGAFSNFSPEAKRITVVVGILAGAVGPLLVVLGSVATIVAGLSIKFIAISSAIAALALGILFVVDNWEAFKERFSDIGWWKNALIDMIQFLIEHSPISLFIKGINAALEFLGKNPIPNPFEGMADGLDSLKGETKEYKNDFQDFSTFIGNQAEKIKKSLGGLGDAFGLGQGGGESQPQAPKFDLSKFTDFSFRITPIIEPAAFSLLVKTKEEIDALNEAAKKLAQTQMDVAQTFKSAFHSMAVSAEASGKQMADAAANAARQVIKAKVAEATAAYVADAFSKFGLLGLVLGAAAGSIVGSIFNKVIPPFADGGMVSGATLAMVGEGAGTSAVNPEVIAPLDKLQGMIGNAGGNQVEVVGRISGSDILLASDRAKGNRNRTRGY
tara:strand:+ start:134 stop:1978 length:1845 start_codon:yes stop_codon:yes gene_type:complete